MLQHSTIDWYTARLLLTGENKNGEDVRPILFTAAAAAPIKVYNLADLLFVFIYPSDCWVSPFGDLYDVSKVHYLWHDHFCWQKLASSLPLPWADSFLYFLLLFSLLYTLFVTVCFPPPSTSSSFSPSLPFALVFLHTFLEVGESSRSFFKERTCLTVNVFWEEADNVEETRFDRDGSGKYMMLAKYSNTAV